ncbi:MAG TPA: DUF5615 family PIN-like protein [Ktedonobacterales bacterium]|nr:DUF5615 family PIN-like protein [Ktedonobacterales bacterium]
MKPLVDHNLSPRLVQRLADLYPDAGHVYLRGLDRASEADVWNYAKSHRYTFATKDSDFDGTSILRGSSPKVVWLRLGNCTTSQVEQTLRHAHDQIQVFVDDPAAGILELFSA